MEKGLLSHYEVAYNGHKRDMKLKEFEKLPNQNEDKHDAMGKCDLSCDEMLHYFHI